MEFRYDQASQRSTRSRYAITSNPHSKSNIAADLALKVEKIEEGKEKKRKREKSDDIDKFEKSVVQEELRNLSLSVIGWVSCGTEEACKRCSQLKDEIEIDMLIL